MIEVMVAILLTAIATSGIVGLYIVETRASGFSRHMTEATILAEDRLERLRTLPLTAGTVLESNIDEHGNAGGIFNRESIVTDTTPAYADMQITVAWQEDGITRTVILRSRRNK